MNEQIIGNKFITRIKNRMLKHNKNWLAICCGDTGSGKSYTALYLADVLNPRGLNIERDVCLTPEKFLERINSPELRRGDVIVFDEAGVGMPARDWHSLQNKLLSSVFQTFRNLNQGVIFTTPNLSFVDSQARKLFHNYFETVSIDHKRKNAYLRVYDIQYNNKNDKVYYKAPQFDDKTGSRHKMKMIRVPMIAKRFIDEYEPIKSEFTKKLNRKALEEVNKINAPKKNKKSDGEIIEEIKKNVKPYIKEYNKRTYIDSKRIMLEYDIGRRRAEKIKQKCEVVHITPHPA